MRTRELDAIRAYVLTFREVGDTVASLESKVDAAYRRLYPLASGVVIVATCNRFEVYLDTPRDADRVLEALGNVLGPETVSKLRVLEGVEAVRHLFKVAAGLDSKILGDHEVLGQVRRAWMKAREEGYVSKLLDTVFHYAVVAGKRVREETGLGRGRIGYPSAAVDLAYSLAGRGVRVLVVGTGSAAESLASMACRRLTPRLLLVAGRSPVKAWRLARSSGCPHADAIPLDGLPGVRGLDVALVAVSGRLDNPETVTRTARYVIDISMPPALEGPSVFGYRAVERHAARMVEELRSEIGRAETIVEEEVSKLVRRLEARRADRAVAAIMSYAETLVQEEALEAARRLGLDETGSRVVETAMYSLVKRLLHPLIQTLRSLSLDGSPEAVEAVARAYESRLKGGRG